MTYTRKQTFTWDLAVDSRRLWPVLADTARFNEAAGFPKHAIEEIPRADGSVQFIAYARFGPFSLDWEDYPQNWVDQHWFRHLRRFRVGPMESLCATLRLSAHDQGSRCHYEVEVTAANAIGRWLCKLGLFKLIHRKFDRLVRDAEEFCRGQRTTEFRYPAPRLRSGAKARAQQIATKIAQTRYAHGLAERLGEFVLSRPEVDVSTIRPLRLAREWQVPERAAIDVCLEGVRQGMLGLRWDLLCPRCQVGKQSVAALKDLPSGSHCSSCNIDFKQDFASNVELAFHPSASLRDIDTREYCLMGPMTTPHIKVQMTLDPDQHCTELIRLEPGSYRARTLEPGAEATFEWRAGGFPTIYVTDSGIQVADPTGAGEIRVCNRSQRSRTVIIEELAWRRDALTALRATTLQSFRDLFDADVLRPGDDVEIDSISIMFTDLEGSTALYDRIGDPQAYVLVREHFEILGAAVRENNGSIVKMVGDAIMAVFASPDDALVCAIRIHDDIAAFNQTSGTERLTVKVGLHLGRCISVTLNDKLDYYGSVPNMAARLQGQSVGNDIVLSTAFAEDPRVDAALRGFKPARETVELKGFINPVPFLRISAQQLAAHRSAAAV